MTAGATLIAVGDVGPYRHSEPEKLFEFCAPMIREADLAFCHLDTPYSDRGAAGVSRVAPRRGPPTALKALKDAGFGVVSFASNHGLDFGVEPFLDTLTALQREHHVVGAGVDLESARRPAIVVLDDGTRIGFLAYCSIVMGRLSDYVADVGKPGVAPLRAWTHYEPVVPWRDYHPGTPARTITFAYPEDIAALREDTERLREQVDVVVVSQHCGVPLIRAHIAMYQFQIAEAAIDAGANIVLQHHAHILRGIGFYRGKPIFYGLGDFGYEAGLSTEGTALQPGRRETKQVEEYYGSSLRAGSASGGYVGPAERRYTMAAKFTIADGAVQRVAYLPARLNDVMQASVHGSADPVGQEVYDYVEAISREAGLETTFRWDGDEVVVTPDGSGSESGDPVRETA